MGLESCTQGSGAQIREWLTHGPRFWREEQWTQRVQQAARLCASSRRPLAVGVGSHPCCQKLLKVIKEDNLVVTNFIYKHWSGQYVPKCPKACSGEQTAGSFSRIKNKEVSRGPASGWHLAGCPVFRVKQGHKSYLSLCVLMKHPRQKGLRLGPRNLFQQNYALLTKFNLSPAFVQPHS